MARVYLDRLTADAYCKCFEAIFSAASSATPKFAVGTSLVGIITDWSDHQFAGLEKAVGKDIAESVVKGCQVGGYLVSVLYRGRYPPPPTPWGEIFTMILNMLSYIFLKRNMFNTK